MIQHTKHESSKPPRPVLRAKPVASCDSETLESGADSTRRPPSKVSSDGMIQRTTLATLSSLGGVSLPLTQNTKYEPGLLATHPHRWY